MSLSRAERNIRFKGSVDTGRACSLSCCNGTFWEAQGSR